MSHLIIFGSIGFIVVAFIAIALIVWALDKALSDEHNDNGGGLLATMFLAGFVTIYYFFGSKEHVNSIVSYFVDNPSAILWSFGAYIGLGLIWAFIKWYFFLHKRVNRALENSKYETVYEYTTVKIPTAGENKWRIMSWMMYWPFSAIWTAIDQPIKNAFNYIFIKFEGLFNAISKYMYKDVLDNLEAKKQALRDAEAAKQEEIKRRSQYIESKN